MADVHDQQANRIYISRINDKNIKPEMMERKFLHANSHDYKLQNKNLMHRED